MTDEVKLKIAWQEARISINKSLIESTRAALKRNNRVLLATQKAIQDYGELLEKLEKQMIVLNGELSIIECGKESEII